MTNAIEPVNPSESDTGTITDLTRMVPQSATPSARGTNDVARGVGRKRPQKQPFAGATKNRAPTQRAPLPRPTHCNYLYSSSDKNSPLTRDMKSVIALPIVSALLRYVPSPSIDFGRPRVTMPGCASSWRDLDNLCSKRLTHLFRDLMSQS